MGALYVVSDVHGHRDDLVRALGAAGLADPDGRWTGGSDSLWVLGDLTDRGPDGIGVVELLRSLQEQAPEQVQVLLGNHEALAIGMRRFPESRFASSWVRNGGRARDQDGLGPAQLAWLEGLPAMALVEDYLLVHSDTTAYLRWGSSVEEVNETVRAMLADPDDASAHWDVWAALTGRYAFAGRDGQAVAQRMLATYGGQVVVHGHSVIGSLTGIPSHLVTEPVRYAGGRALAIDGGRYDGGPLLVVRLS